MTLLGLLKDSNVDLVEDEDGFYVEAASGDTGWAGSAHGQEEPFEEFQGTGPYEQQDVVAEHFVGVADNQGASEAMTQEACEDSLGSLDFSDSLDSSDCNSFHSKGSAGCSE